jgi:hypothetical protein
MLNYYYHKTEILNESYYIPDAHINICMSGAFLINCCDNLFAHFSELKNINIKNCNYFDNNQ